MFEYKCKLVKVVDGDTVDVDIDLGFGVWLQNQRIRLYGIDTPESRTSDAEEKKYGLAAKERMQEWLDGGNLKIVTHKDAKGKYGRILGELYTFDTNVNVSINVPGLPVTLPSVSIRAMWNSSNLPPRAFVYGEVPG